MRWVYYFTLLITNQFLFGMLGAYSVAKKGIEDEFNFTQNIFGMGEMLSMIARVLITTYLLLVPPKTLKWTYLVYAVIQAMGYWLISLGHFFPDLSLLLYYSGMFIFGAGRGIYSFPYLILCRTFNQSSDFSALNVWIAISMGGNLWGFYLETFFLDNLQWPWPLGISVFSFIYFFLSLITYAVVEEAEIQSRNTSICDQVSEMIDIMKVFYKRRVSNIVQLVDFCFLQNQMFILLFWLPYYFHKLGYGYQSTYIALAYPIAIIIGSFIFNPLLDRFPEQKGIITSILILITFLSFFAMLFFGSDQSDFPVYIGLIGLGCFTYIVPFTRSFSTELTQKCLDSKEKYLSLNFMRILREFLTGISVLIIGITMQIDNRNFLYIFIINMGLAFIFHIPRRIIECREDTYLPRQHQVWAERQRKQKQERQNQQPRLMEQQD